MLRVHTCKPGGGDEGLAGLYEEDNPHVISRRALTPLCSLPPLTQVFASFCSKVMGPLFGVLSETRSTPLTAAAKALVWDALFHEEHLDGYREAFIAVEASSEAAAASLSGGEGAGGNKKKKRRKGGKDGDDAANTAGAAGGSGRSSQRRASYQQQVLEEMSRLASLVGEKRSCLGSAVGAPLLLEGFILGLKRAMQGGADIHVPSGGSGGGGRANASPVGMSGKRSRSTELSGGVSASTSPASQMFKLWSVLTSTLDSLFTSGGINSSTSGGSSSSGVNLSFIPPPLEKSSSLCCCYLRACNAMLRLLDAHDVYRVNEDRGGVELDRLRAFSKGILHVASGTADRWQVEVEVEFVQVFRSLLMLNHEILHDDSSMVLQMAFEWAAVTEKVMTEKGVAAPSANKKNSSPAATSTASASLQCSREEGGREGGKEDAGLHELRTVSTDLVVSLVDTYGRLRQMDHLVRSLFTVVAARPSAAAAVLRGGVRVEEALRR